MRLHALHGDLVTSPPKVVVRGLRKRYGSIEAVRDVSFSVDEGEIVGLLGPNGAGKTTTIECLIGLREPDAGSIEICGIDARRRPREVKQRIGASLQSTSLQDKITPREALSLFAAFYRDSADPAQLLDRFSLAEKADAPFDALSGGQRQRLALALAFVNRPELVFLDEPTAGLDPQSRRELRAEISRMKDEGHTVMLTTHYIEEAEQLCDRVAIIDRGRIVADGRPRELIDRSGSMPRVSLTTRPPLDPEALAGVPGIEDVTWDERGVSFRAPDATRALGALAARLAERRIEVVELHVQKASLEDIYLAHTGAGPLADGAMRQ
jgi:ABC-2 type transport system ATP-binding protein